MKHASATRQAGFTLPELIVAFLLVALVGVAAMLLLHQNPQTISRNNTARKLDEAALIQGITRYYYAKDSLPSGIPTDYKGIGSESGELDLCKQLVPTYMADLVYDPVAGMITQDGACDAKDQKYHTGYSIKQSNNGKTVSVVATTAEGGKIIVYTKTFK